MLVGNLGKDAEIRETNGRHAISFSVAHNETYKNKDGQKVSRTTWVNCTLWRNGKTSLVNYLKKGVLVGVEGTPSVRAFDSKHGPQASLDLRVTHVELLGGHTENHNSNNNSNYEQSAADKLAGAG